MLRLEGLSCGYGLMRAVDALDFTAEGGRIAALLGANGAGKSSTIQCIAGHVKVFEGRVVYDGAAINDWTPMQRVGAGIALVPEGRRLFNSLSVRENLVIGGYCRARTDTAAGARPSVRCGATRLSSRPCRANRTRPCWSRPLISVNSPPPAKAALARTND